MRIALFWITDICFEQSYQNYFSIGSDNGQTPNRRQAIICTKDSLV